MTTRGPGRPAEYPKIDGQRVPGVTTITGRFKDSGALVRWAWTVGRDGKSLDEARDTAASAGSIAHDMIECDIHGVPYTPPQDVDAEIFNRAVSALDSFKSWRQTTKMTLVATELPLLSTKHRFAGTLDALGVVNGGLCIVDWKTSNGVYPEYLAQIGGYTILWEEHHPDQPITGLHLLRFGKEFADFHHHSWPRAVIDKACEGFLLMRKLYDIDTMMKKMVR